MRPNVEILTTLIQLILTNVQVLVKSVFYIKSLKNIEINVLRYQRKNTKEKYMYGGFCHIKKEFRHGIGAEGTGKKWILFLVFR